VQKKTNLLMHDELSESTFDSDPAVAIVEIVGNKGSA